MRVLNTKGRYITEVNRCSSEFATIKDTHMLVDENWILDLRVYSDYSVSIQRNQDILLQCNNLVLPCDQVEHLRPSML